MLDEIYRLLEREIDGNEVKQFAAQYQTYPLKLSFRSYAEGIAYLHDCYRQFGLDAQIERFPADGKTVYADRHFPLAWDVEDAWAEVDGERIADYRQAPYSVIPFSADSGGICQKQLVPMDALPERGSLTDYAALICRYPTGADVQALIARGCPAFFSTVNLVPVHPSLDDSRRWYNDLFAPGQIDCRDKTCVGFSITPRAARKLMELHAAGNDLTVRYEMKTRTYAGEAPAVTACIPGTQDDLCFFMTAHGYEPHATNNVAGVAACLVAAKTLARLIGEGKLLRPSHSIRFFHGLENFSLYAWGMENRSTMKRALGGISVDSFGRASAGGFRERFVLRRCLNIHPSNQHAIARELLRCACAARDIGFEVRESSSNNEELMQDPQFGPAWNLLYGSLWEEPRETYPRCYFYHTDVDTVDQLSPETLSAAAVVAAALAYYVACGVDSAEVSALACEDWKRIVDAKCREALQLKSDAPALRTLRAQRLAVWRDLSIASAMASIPDPALAAEFRADALRRTDAAMTLLHGAEPPKMPQPSEYRQILRRLVPGPIGLGTIPDNLRPLAEQALGYACNEYWCLDGSGANLYHFDGQKTVFQVAQAVWATRAYSDQESPDGLEKELRYYSKLAQLLLQAGLAEEVPRACVTKETLLDGLRRLSITAGDCVMVHSSLKSFGYVEGGADTVIDALLEAVTSDGIVSMPAFTDCVDGGDRGVYDPESTCVEPWIGRIPEAFRTRAGVLRSKHPTHSICAAGNRAAQFLQQSDPYDCFAKDGPWEWLRSRGGKILFFGETYGSNTFLHACEAWYGAYLESTTAYIRTPGGCKSVTVTNYPGGCRGGWYKLGKKAAYYQALEARGIFTQIKIGNAAVSVCSAKALSDAMQEILAEQPFILLHTKGCRECARFRGNYYARKKI